MQDCEAADGVIPANMTRIDTAMTAIGGSAKFGPENRVDHAMMDDLTIHRSVGGPNHPRDFRRHGGVIAAGLNASPILVSNLPSDSIQFVDKAIRGWFGQSTIGVVAMGTEHPQRNKEGRVREKSLRLDAPADDALLLLEENALEEDDPSLWAEEPSKDVQSLLEENARLRGLLVEISGLIRRKVVDQR